MAKNLIAAVLAFILLGSVFAIAQSESVNSGDGATTHKACSFQLGAAIFGKWQTMRNAGTIGCPVNSEGEAMRSLQGTTGRWAQFAPGTTGATDGYIIAVTSGVHAGMVYGVHGCVYNIYNAQGSTGGVFGFPVSDEYDMPGGLRADFEGGNIQWNAATGICVPQLNPPARPG